MLRKFLPLLFVTLLCACGSTQQQTGAALTPLPSGPTDLPDSAVKTTVRSFLTETKAPQASQYSFSRIDLNDDGRRDALVLFKNPYGYWCGIHGCAMLVLKAGDNAFSLVNDVQPIREPVYISEEKTKGWRDIIVRVSGRSSKAKDVALRYNGRAYPRDPSSLPGFTKLSFNRDTKVLMN